MNPKDILEKYYHFAVVGVTPNQEKYGYKIFKRLLEKGYQTYGVSPIYQNIDDIPTYPNLEAIDHPIDVVVFVVSPKYAYDYVDEMSGIGIRYAWMQPGTYDDQLLQYMQDQGITCSCLYFSGNRINQPIKADFLCSILYHLMILII